MNGTIVTQRSEPRLMVDGSYLVDSATDTLVSYTVRNLEHGWECNCIAGAHRRVCWHVTAVLAIEAANEAPELEDDLAAITRYLEEESGSPDSSSHVTSSTTQSIVRKQYILCPRCKGYSKRVKCFCVTCGGAGEVTVTSPLDLGRVA